MFCPKCGTNVPDGQQFCAACGEKVTPVIPAVPVAPVQAKPMSGKPILITFILSLILLIASVVAPLVKNLNNSLLFSEMDLTEDLEEAIVELQLANDLLPEQIEAVTVMTEKLEKLNENFSLLNFRSAAQAMHDYGSVYDPNGTYDLSELLVVLTAAIWIIVGIFLLPLLFTLLGGLKKSTGLTITALILTALPQLILSGFLLFLLSTTVLIIQAVLCSKYKKAKTLALAQ